MKNLSSFIQNQAFRDHTSLLSILSYLLIYLAVLGLGWAEASGSFSWHWKIALLVLSSILFVISISRNFSYEKNAKQNQLDTEEKGILLEKINKLEKEKQEAQDANQAKSKFLAEMSHEIRNPLNSILGFSEVLAKRKMDAKSKKFVDMITQSGDGLLCLLNDILDLDKIGEGKLSLESIPFHFKEVVSSTLLPYEYEAKQKGIHFELIFDPQLPRLLIADPYRFRQILLNLVSNSMKFTQKGKIRVQFLRQEINEERVSIRTIVSDTGIGIAQEKQASIFNPFIQSEDSTTRKFGGSGLGLTIVAELLKLMGGEINIKSPNPQKPSPLGGPGSQFFFDLSLPYKVEKRPYDFFNKTKEEPENMHISQDVHILVAEDNALNQLLFQTILEGLGVSCDIVGNGQEALDALQSSTHYDMVFMDIQMPVMDGLKASKCIRQDLELSIPIIGTTANAFKEDIRESLQSGMNDYVAKPFRQKDLYKKILKWGIKERIKN